MRTLHPVHLLQVRMASIGLHVQCNDIVQYTDNVEESPILSHHFSDEGNMFVLNSSCGPISTAVVPNLSFRSQ